MTQEFINITPHKSIMLKLGQSGYSLTEALAELVDNSLDARVPEKQLKVNIENKKGCIIIEDNASGMDKQEAANSIKLGYSQKKNQLGKFGLGMKTACASMGKNFEITTTKNQTCSLIYDEDEWLKNGSWNRFPIDITEKDGEDGTKIIIRKLIINPSEGEWKKVRKEFSKRFSPFLQSNELNLIINKEECQSYEFKLTKEGKKEFEIELSSGNKIKGWFGFKLMDSGDYFGFNTYRRNRLITSFDKFALTTNQKAKQIVGEINMNHTPVTHNKRGWIRESKEFKEVKKAVIELIKAYDIREKKIIAGTAAHPGRVDGIARVLSLDVRTKIEDLNKIKKGDIIVTDMTRPQFLLQIRRAAAIITNQGGALCHAAIVAREFGIPCITGTINATEMIKDGQKIVVDAHKGVIYDGE